MWLLPAQLPLMTQGGCWDMCYVCVLTASNEGGPRFLARDRARPEESLGSFQLVAILCGGVWV